MEPYRSREEPGAAKVAPQTGLIADMVRQFADVHAFVRELVQNGIDAGASALEVSVDRSLDGVLSVRVTDDGCGMTMEVIEEALLVLFRSTKDTDSTKIGKYGVGFMSVFAIEPSEVTVDTWREGSSLRLRLFPDHSYEIEHALPREGSGTSVTVSKPIAGEDFAQAWQKAAASLHRWCRHAELPIHFVVNDATSGQPPRTGRADRPFEVRAAVSARRRYPDGMEIVVGPIAGSAGLPAAGSAEDEPSPFAGFYNRGLTLHETTVPLSPKLEAVRVKVKSSGLCHTLSRDDVRRDQAFARAIARAQALVAEELRAVALGALEEEARACAERGAASARLATLIEIATLPPVLASTEELRLPLAHPTPGMKAMSLKRSRALVEERLGLGSPVVLTSSERTELTTALARRGVPVLLVDRAMVAAAVARASGGELLAVPASHHCLLVRELPPEARMPGDGELCAGLGAALADAGVGRVAIGEILGEEGRIGVLVKEPAPGATEHVVLAREASVAAPRWPSGSLLVLRAEHEAVASARRAASKAIAAHLLARYLLLLGPGLTSRRSEALALRALGGVR
jgi:molecular chaperone HtpG